MTSCLTDFQIDIWFLYGSFAYGIESLLCAFSQDTVKVVIPGSDSDNQTEIQTFIDNLIQNPKGLLRTEIRIYNSEKQIPNTLLYGELAHPLHFPVTLYTERVPSTSESNAGRVCIQFREIRALTAADHTHFSTLVDTVWPKFPAP